MTDPVASFVHDHRELNRLVVAVAAALGRVVRGEGGLESERDEINDALSTIRDELLHHFAVEEEGLFPSLRSLCPDLAEDLAALEGEHGLVCAAADEVLGALQSASADASAIVRAFERFQQAYSAHAAAEAAALESASARLTDEGRAAIARAVQDL
jgi:iron-sulfur cluster repair protein YtfE (RIC family)